MPEESPIITAKNMLSEAELKLSKAEFLRKLASIVRDEYDIEIGNSVQNKLGAAPAWKGRLLTDAMKAGCAVHSAYLESQAKTQAISAAKLLAGETPAGPAPLAPKTEPLVVVTEEMVTRFLNWPIPESVRCDPCMQEQQAGRIGTSIMTATEARVMLEHVLQSTASK